MAKQNFTVFVALNIFSPFKCSVVDPVLWSLAAGEIVYGVDWEITVAKCVPRFFIARGTGNAVKHFEVPISEKSAYVDRFL